MERHSRTLKRVAKRLRFYSTREYERHVLLRQVMRDAKRLGIWKRADHD
jgi:hypothetical protein